MPDSRASRLAFIGSHFMPPSTDSTIPRSVFPASPGSWWKDLSLIGVLAMLWFCSLLGMRPLTNPDEGRYTEIPREMAVSGDYVTPRLNGVKYFEKPPLVYWLSALTFEKFGVSQFTARLWNALFAVAGVLITYAASRAIYGRDAGIWAAIILASNLMYYIMSQIILLDMAVAVTMSAALFSFILGMRVPAGKKRFWLFMGFYVSMALAVLSKGLIGIALPGAVMFLWVLLLNRWRGLWPFYPLVGTLVLLAIAAPWHLLAARANPDFLQFYFIHEHWERFTTQVHGRYEPFWFFIPVLLVGLFPWVFFSAQACRESLAGGWQALGKNAEAWFFVIWIGFIFLFFSKSQSKLIPYLLPVFPAAAALLGRTLASCWAGKSRLCPSGIGGYATVTCLLASALIGSLFFSEFIATKLVGEPELLAHLPTFRVTLCGSLLLGAVGAFLGLRRKQPRLILAAVSLSAFAFFAAAGYGGSYYQKSSSKKFAEQLLPILRPEDRVYTVCDYTQDFPPYLGRQVSVVSYMGELEFGIRSEPEKTSSRFLNNICFIDDWARPGQAYALVRRSFYENAFSKLNIPHSVLSENRRYVLIAKIKPAL